jgi:hypothetical protein
MKRLTNKSLLTTITIKLLIAMCSVGLATASAHANEITIEILPSLAAENSSLSRVVSDERGQIYLSWVTQEAGLARLSFAQLTADGWTEPEIIKEGNDWFVNWADFPGLTVNEGNIAAFWLKKSAEGTFDYDIQARFFDAGKNRWSADSIIHKDGVSAEHGFVSMLPMHSGQTFFSWLDGRETTKDDGAMTLRGGVFDASGNTVNEWELDHRVCDCCQTSSAITSSGPIVVYRDRTENEIRDIYITRYSKGKWTEPKPIHIDNWQVAGCPVNGPAVSAKDNQVVVSWFTAKDDTPKVQLAVSNDNGVSFSAPVLVASPNTNGRVGNVILGSGKIVVSWMDTTKQEAKIVLSLFSAEGRFIESTNVAMTSASRRSGFPIIEGVGESVYVTWTDISESPQVKIARINYQGQ